MLRLYNDQPDLWEATLPKQLQGLPPELAAMDTLLRDSAFTAPFEAALREKVREEVFSDFQGRPSTFLSSYVRLMVLKFRRAWSYEELLVSVNESVFLRRFCGYSLSDELPDDTTLIKLTGRLGEDFVKTLNRALVVEAKKRRMVQGQRMRVDTTVVGANIRYPTDTGLLADSIRKIGRLVKRIKTAGKAKRVAFWDRTRWAKKIVRQLGQRLKDRGASAKAAAKRAKVKLLQAAVTLKRQAEIVHDRVHDSKEQAVRRSAEALALYLALLQKLIEQTEQVLKGQFSIPGRLVSLFDPDARPIEKGKLFPKVEFGFKALFQEAENGIVTGYDAFVGNPHDTTLLPDALKTHQGLFGHAPEDLATDRGFDDQQQREKLAAKIRHLSIPARGYNKDPAQRQREATRWFYRLQKWRAGGEAKGSLLKRLFGWSKTLMKGREGASIWIGHGTLAHNLWQMARLANSS